MESGGEEMMIGGWWRGDDEWRVVERMNGGWWRGDDEWRVV